MSLKSVESSLTIPPKKNNVESPEENISLKIIVLPLNFFFSSTSCC